jgi:hypothetical protein
MWLAMLAGVAFCGICVVLLGYLFVTAKRPVVRLDELGVTARGYKNCPVPWGEVDRVWKGVQQYGFNRANYVCINLKDPTHWRTNQRTIAKLVGAYARAMGLGDMNISTSLLNASADELVAVIELYIDNKSASAPAI